MSISGRAGGWFYAWLALTALVLGADQGTKVLVSESLAYGERVSVLPVFAWTLVHNDGAAFSLLAGSGGWQRWLLVVVAVGFSGVLVAELRNAAGWFPGVGLALLLGGALGNGYDRLMVGYVVDFVLVYWNQWYFPAFNLADAAITVGAGIWIVWALLPAANRMDPTGAGGP